MESSLHFSETFLGKRTGKRKNKEKLNPTHELAVSLLTRASRMLQCNFLSPQAISEVLHHVKFLLELDQTILTVDNITNSCILSYTQQQQHLKLHGFQESIKKACSKC